MRRSGVRDEGDGALATIGVPAELKNNEGRVALTPAGVDALVSRGHTVRIEQGAGAASQIDDASYARAGAALVTDADEVWGDSQLVLKVKEPIPSEYRHFREDLQLFTYLHLAAAPELTRALLDSGTTAIAYETVQLSDGSLPLLTPMSEVAGRLSITVGSYYLMQASGGRGCLLGGIAGAGRAKVVVLGGGVAGEHAAANALGMGADVTVLDISLPRLRELERRYNGALQTRASTRWEIAEQVAAADLVIGSVLVPGAAAPKLITKDMVARMRPGAVLVDIAVDQGGCFEGSRPTTHDDPTFNVHRSIYYCVANMPGAVPVTSTRALTNATLPYVIAVADMGWDAAAATDPALAAGLNVRGGTITNAAVADAYHAA